ncbi:Ig-like domain repeat protein [Pseudomonas sp. IT-347P]|uniref:hypothetical protein n=1 Tax=Pseudomonas sp. IT-347P TaxID=3026458 RepID=UPI0039DF4730
MSTSQPNAIVPSIVSIKGASGAEIAEGGTTNETSVTLAGKAEKSQKVAVYDSGLVKDQADVDSKGNWTSSLSDLSVGPHRMTAKALYGDGDMSQRRNFTVAPNN